MIPLFSAPQVRDADAFAINTLGMPSIVLMENAARSIAYAIQENYGNNCSLKTAGIVCGKGNNGGDGFALARHLMINGFSVKVIALGDEEQLKGDALTNFRILKNFMNEYSGSKLLTYESQKDLSTIEDCELIIDAMLGTGSRGELTEPYRTIVERINQLGKYRIAVDLPSGLDLENSDGSVIFDADMTVTLSEFKTGLFYGKGYLHAGKIEKGSIGIGDEYYRKLEINDYLIEPEDAFYGLPFKELDIHKYSAGKVLAIAGSGSLPGAAFFSINSAMKAGAGAGVLAFPATLKTLAQQKLESSTVLPYNDSGKEFLTSENLSELSEKTEWADAVILGPGLGRNPETVEAVLEIIKNSKSKKFIIDADALFALGGGEYQKLNLKGKILTPHHKEFADILGIDTAELQRDILNLGRKFALETGCHLVLKGAPTIIFNPSGEAFINSAGNPGMAKFGVGDVLSGILGAFVAQSAETEEAIFSAVYIHSLTADLLLDEKTEYGITATDIMESIPDGINFLLSSFVQGN